MTLVELQKVLGDNIDKINSEHLTSGERQVAIEKADMISRLAKQMINNADVILRTDKLMAENKIMCTSSIAAVMGDPGTYNERDIV